MNLLRALPLFILGLLQPAQAQPVPENQMPRLPDIQPSPAREAMGAKSVVEGLKNNFSHVTCFAYVEERTQKNEVYWQACWKEIGNKYYYEVVSGAVDNIVAFDGNITSSEHGKSGIVNVKSGEFLALKPTNLPSPLDLYSFLKSDDRFLCLNELRSSSPLWDGVTTRITYAGIQRFLDRDCVVWRFWNSFSHVIKEKADYDVYFDPRSSTPLGWRAFDHRKFMIEQLEVLEFKTITDKTNATSFTYPSHYRVTEYQWSGTLTGPDGVIKYYKGIRDLHPDLVEINNLSPEDVQIDSSLTKSIFDLDSKVVTRLSR